MPVNVPDDYYFAEKALVKSLWDKILDNLQRHGSKSGQEITAHLSDDNSELLITILDTNDFDFNRFIRRNSSLQDYIKMNRFGALAIASGQALWCSSDPYTTRECESVFGTRISLRFVLKENEIC